MIPNQNLTFTTPFPDNHHRTTIIQPSFSHIQAVFISQIHNTNRYRMEDCEIIVSKEPAARPAKEGLNARQRRKQRKRAERLASCKYIFPSLYSTALQCKRVFPPSSHQISWFTPLQRRMLTGLAAQHLDFVRKALIKKRTKQANRWVDHQTRSNQIPGLENEIRWGLKTRKPWLLTDDGQAVFDRLEREMSAALARLNKEKKAVDPDAEDETWVDDW